MAADDLFFCASPIFLLLPSSNHFPRKLIQLSATSSSSAVQISIPEFAYHTFSSLLVLLHVSLGVFAVKYVTFGLVWHVWGHS
jgi:hypothetical protein